ncbi:DUF2268 domain-containing putative Zn-dependent protease [Bacillus horti]|uniref:DUF2268 domain-containing protein n=1 Tax=Caldalkalibacillus horti TaxID=77523 RepID=A0ABT9W122_9BACI|nr:DUF2268 domain-containing putative Zn-dependent protease [Bacillus horti]MDQ0166901.1 hypothetical protein [Bacillus horti]
MAKFLLYTCKLIVFSLLFLTACEVSEDEDVIAQIEVQETEEGSFTFVHKDTEFFITTFFDHALEYVSLARESDRGEWERIYRETILEPFRLIARGGKHRINSLDEGNFRYSYRLDEYESYINLIKERQDEILEAVILSLNESTELLPSKLPINIFLFVANPEEAYYNQYVSGVSGFADKDRNIVIHLDPISLDIDILKYISAHEYHHAIVFEDMIVNRRPLDFLEQKIIMEGKADTFAQLIYPDTHVPWLDQLEEEEHVWNIMKKVMEPDSNLSVDFFRGNHGMRIPMASNYKIGYQIMQDFLENNPEVTLEEWTAMWATEILEKSKFEDRFK